MGQSRLEKKVVAASQQGGPEQLPEISLRPPGPLLHVSKRQALVQELSLADILEPIAQAGKSPDQNLLAGSTL